MLPRDPREPHRVATPLELLYDLCFVVAIAQASAGLHHSLSEGHAGAGLLGFAMVFFAIWWAWMGFTWFASAFDTDDVLYRTLVLIQIFGLLVIAAGVPRGFADRDFTGMAVGYAVMRVGLVAQWLRAAGANPSLRTTALRYAAGLCLCQLGWLGLLALPPAQASYGWLLLVPAELLVPVWAEAAGPTPWHPHHIAERYGLMTIIVLGESVLAATLAIQSALDAGHPTRALVGTILGTPLILFSM
jgi:low temperature requirement protein LtrA